MMIVVKKTVIPKAKITMVVAVNATIRNAVVPLPAIHRFRLLNGTLRPIVLIYLRQNKTFATMKPLFLPVSIRYGLYQK